jgi:TolB-like protein
MSLFAELTRRNVIRVGIAYAIVAWVLAQVAEFAFENFGAPDWVLKSVVVILLLGLPLALFFAWAFEMTPEGVKREKDVDRSKSITTQTGRKLDYVIIAVLALAVTWFSWDKFAGNTTLEHAPETSVQVNTTEVPQESTPDAAAEKSVAVLPFIAMSSGQDDEYFADGLTEEILNSLAQLPELLVTARTSAFSFKGQDIPVQEIAAALGVQHIVEGSVRRSGDRLRVTAQLIRASDAFHLWSENYDSTSTDTIAVQEDIAEKIAAALDIVLDENKREAMKQAGLRDVKAFTLYQKGREAFERAHGEMDTIEGLRQANTYFEQVIERVPMFSPAYVVHSDLFIHLLTDDATGTYPATSTPEEMANAYPAAIADYEAARQYAPSPESRHLMEIDLAFISGNWRGLGGRIERAFAEAGCHQANWFTIIADVFGYSEQLLKRSYDILKCDPRRSLSWFNTARTALNGGDKEQALRVAREGSEIAPGGWLNMALIRALVANGLHEEARQEIDARIQDISMVLPLRVLVAAHEGDRERYEHLYEQFIAELGNDSFWRVIVAAWGGHREEVNHLAAKIDQHPFGSMPLVQVTQWCGCGAPWDLEATPNFAAKIKEGSLTWPPQPTMEFPLKDW